MARCGYYFGLAGQVGVLGLLITPWSAHAADAHNYVSTTASALDAATASVTVNLYREDHWSLPKTNARVYRTDSLTGTPNWGSPIATLPWGTSSYVDTNVEVGKRYLYRVDVDGPTNVSNPSVQKNYASGGIATPATLDRGIMLLVTDSVTSPQLAPEIEQFKRDLIGDGYRVQRIDVLPTDTPQAVKAQIVAAYQANPSLVKSVTLLGNVPVPHTGWVNPDGHGGRPFPSDSYYADVNGTWTDSSRNSNNTGGNYAWWVNTPGDGKFDQSSVPTATELQIGRITFNNLPLFAETDVELTRRYLAKNHAYRHNQFTFEGDLYIGVDSTTGYAASGALFGTDYRPHIQTSASGQRDEAYWAEQEAKGYWLTTWYRGGGTYTGTWGIGTSADFAATNGVKTAIHGAWASYYGEWDVQNAFLRSILAAEGQTVNTFYGGTPDWRLYALGAGETVGFAAQMSTNQQLLGFGNTSNTIIPGLLGDPSIRLFPVAPASGLDGKMLGEDVLLTWDASVDTDILGYLVFRAASIDDPFVALTADLLTGTSFIDPDPLTTNTYMIRAIALEETGSGSYLNPSQGIFVEVVVVPEPGCVTLIFACAAGLIRRQRRSEARRQTILLSGYR